MRNVAVALAGLACAACGHAWANLPVTEVSHPATESNARVRGTAPPVVAGLAAGRLEHAADEPRNWLTYYGTYDGQRYSRLAQIDTSNVKDSVWSHRRRRTPWRPRRSWWTG